MWYDFAAAIIGLASTAALIIAFFVIRPWHYGDGYRKGYREGFDDGEQYQKDLASGKPTGEPGVIRRRMAR